MKKNLISGVSLFLIGLLFIAATLLINRFLTNAQLDLTEHGLFTTSEGARSILNQIDEPINLYFFFSEQVGGHYPALREHANRVREMLNNFSQVAGDQLRVQIIDPEPFSEAEDRALDFGLRGIKLPNQGDFYFGLVGTNAIGQKELIPFFRPENGSFLEYDLAKLIYNLSRTRQPVLGLYSSLPLSGHYDYIQQRAVDAWTIFEQLDAQFDLRELPEGFDQIDSEIDVLMMVHPKNPSVETLYAIDQFLARGGRAFFLIDPFAEAEVSVVDNPYNDRISDKSSGLETLFNAWGVEISRQELLADRSLAIPVKVAHHNRPVTHLTVLGFGKEQFNRDEIITRQLNGMNVAHAGFIQYDPNPTLNVTPLIQSTPDSGAMPVDNLRYNTDPTHLLDAFEPDQTPKALAVRIEGLFHSAFGEVPPETVSSSDPHLANASRAGNVVIIADVDFLQDPLWVHTQKIGNQTLTAPFSNNGDFVNNVIDSLGGSDALITIRGRGDLFRPFDYVNELRKEAEAEFRETEQRLVEQLSRTEQRIRALEEQRDSASAVHMTPEQEAAITQFMQEHAKIRKQLREVRHQLDKNIEQLGIYLRLINILAIPLLVALFGTIVAIIQLRHRYRAQDRVKSKKSASTES